MDLMPTAGGEKKEKLDMYLIPNTKFELQGLKPAIKTLTGVYVGNISALFPPLF